MLLSRWVESARPRTTPISKTTSKRSSGKIRESPPEPLEFEWPDLPPIDRIKDALTRNTISRGITYILPVDKSKASVENQYRTDLRALFQEPYVDEAREFQEERLLSSAKIHFRNDVNARCTGDRRHGASVRINADSEKWRQLYARSAPSSGGCKPLDSFGQDKRRRSNLILPIKTPVPPEAVKMRKEAEKILQSVRDEETGYTAGEEIKTADDTLMQNSSREMQCDIDRKREEEMPRLKTAQTLPLLAQKEEMKVFTSYSDIKDEKAPRLMIPAKIRSDFLTHDKNQDIWKWLHFGEELSDFEYFLSVCG